MSSHKLLILFYNQTWVFPPQPLPNCVTGCEFTRDSTQLGAADAVIFHLPTLREGIALSKRPGQVWVAFSMESDILYPRMNDPAFLAQFDLTMTYRRDADIWSPYFGPALADQFPSPSMSKTETAPVVFFCSSPVDRSGRTVYTQQLMEWIRVDSYGKLLNNRSLPADRGRETKLDTMRRYHFTLAFENSISRDYVTEKFFDPLIAGSVPIYLGAPNIDEFAPAERCFINVGDFKGPRELALYLHHLKSNPTEYEAYLAWKGGLLSPSFLVLLERLKVHPFCQLCRKVAELLERGSNGAVAEPMGNNFVALAASQERRRESLNPDARQGRR